VREYFRGGGFSSGWRTQAAMPLTMTRLNLIKGLGPMLQVVEGWSVELARAIYEPLEARTNPTWPSTWFAPRLTAGGPCAEVYSVMANWGANHGALSCGHIGADLLALAAVLRIPVSLHNVPEAKIFRPAVWAAFGAMEPQGADFRACAAYGPLYGD